MCKKNDVLHRTPKKRIKITLTLALSFLTLLVLTVAPLIASAAGLVPMPEGLTYEEAFPDAASLDAASPDAAFGGEAFDAEALTLANSSDGGDSGDGSEAVIDDDQPSDAISVITITKQPEDCRVYIQQGIDSDAYLEVEATVEPNAPMNYYWYIRSNILLLLEVDTFVGEGARLELPPALAPVNSSTVVYYYCYITSEGADPVFSTVAEVVYTYIYVDPGVEIVTQPAASTDVFEGAITQSLFVEARPKGNTDIYYQWCENTSASNVGGTPIQGANSPVFFIPADLTAEGSPYYYYCYVMGGINAVYSDVATVIVKKEVTGVYLVGIELTALPTISSYDQGDLLDLTGLEVMAIYSDGTTVNIIDYILTNPLHGAVLDTPGNQVVLVFYDEGDEIWSYSFTVTVREGPAPVPKALISITGPATVETGEVVLVEYIISAEDAPLFSVVELQIEVDAEFLSFAEATEVGGFAFIGAGAQGSPIVWTHDDNIWWGKMTLLYLGGGPGNSGASGDVDIVRLVFRVIDYVLGETEVKLNYIILSQAGLPVEAEIVKGSAITVITERYSPFDLTKDGVIDLNDLSYALQFLSVGRGNPNWDAAMVVDFNNDGIITMEDLILIMANYTNPYY